VINGTCPDASVASRLTPHRSWILRAASPASVSARTSARCRTKGWRPLIVGVVGECAIAALTLGLVLGAAQWLV
jgi:hypothetical protein